MARPTTINDLPSYDTMPVTLAEFSSQELVNQRRIKLIKAMYEFATEAEEAGLLVKDQYNKLVIHRPLTQRELDERLASAQRTWDRYEEKYHAAAEDPAEWLKENEVFRPLVDSHAENEGHAPINWDEGENA